MYILNATSPTFFRMTSVINPLNSLKTTFLVLLLCIGFIVNSQTIPSERLVDWSQAGYIGQKPEPSRIIDFAQAGGVADGVTANDNIFNTVIASITDSAIIYFPAGKYFFARPLGLKNNIIIRGAGNNATELLFNLVQERHLVQAIGRKESTRTAIVAGISKGANTLTVQDASGYLAGNYILLSDNDSSTITSTWAYGSTGQMVQIASINGKELTLTEALRRDYQLTKNPIITKLTPIQNVGIEAIKISRLDATVDQTSNIFFLYASNCWVKCVESYKCNMAHVDVSTSSHIEIKGSYFHGAHGYGSGGKGYGVILQATSGDCLVQENVFDSLRHSMILQSGANGNVLAYNYSDHPYWTETFLPSNSAGDIVLHGNYPYANLFEGNTVQHIVIDNSHGINGPYNTIFRNRANGYGFFMNSGPASDYQNIVGNEITNTSGTIMGLYMLAGVGHFEYGNNHKGTIKPQGTDTLAEASMFLDSLPSYYTAKHICPPIGLPNNINEHIIEAQFRYQERNFTECTPTVWLPEQEDTTVAIDTTIEQPIDTSIIEEPIDTNAATAIGEETKPIAQLYPNPASSYLTIALPADGNATVRLFDLAGRLIMGYTFTGQQHTINVSSLQAGLYLYELRFYGQVQRGKVLVE
ncbi:hypothetical protein BH09BAC1_BH09BAC1_07750 [soil metagenome]